MVCDVDAAPQALPDYSISHAQAEVTAMTRHADDLADRLEQLGKFEIFRDYSNERSQAVWLTESERDLIVYALRWWVIGGQEP